MDFFNLPPGVDLLPPEDVRIRSLRVEPWPEGARVKIFIELTPFQQKPNLDLTVLDTLNRELANSVVIETMVFRLVLTMHLPPDTPAGGYRVLASLYYRDQPPVDSANADFELHGSSSSE